MIDESDFTYWKDHFGDSLPTGGESSAAGESPVPEPATATLMLLAVIAMCAVRSAKAK
jgi:PEP-CTERM motif